MRSRTSLFWLAAWSGLFLGIAVAAEPFPGTATDWHGFRRHDFESGGHAATVVVPDAPLPGNPWAWRGEFFGAFADADVELVRRGFHLAYLKVRDRFGCPEAVAKWDRFYAELTGIYGLGPKPALIGLSRGGLYCLNWAIANPDQVSCLYLDAPVCDFRSWPGGAPHGLGKGKGSEAEWEKLLVAYGFSSTSEAIAYPGQPVENLAPLAAADVPILLVYGDADDVVPCEENAKVVAERYAVIGGRVEQICKAGVAHHPHGLPDPEPIVAFLERHAR